LIPEQKLAIVYFMEKNRVRLRSIRPALVAFPAVLFLTFFILWLVVLNRGDGIDAAGAGTYPASVALSRGMLLLFTVLSAGLTTIALVLSGRLVSSLEREIASVDGKLGTVEEELGREKTRRLGMERETVQSLEAQSLLVERAMGLIAIQGTSRAVQYLADTALDLFKVRASVVGAFPVENRVLEIVGIAYHSSADDQCRVKKNISGKGLFRNLYEGKLETIVCNDLESHPLRGGFPEGHPLVTKAIIVPLVNLSMEMIGLFILGDRLDGEDFTESDRTLAELLAQYASAAVARTSAEEDRLEVENRLQNAKREHMMTMSHAARLAALGELTAVMAHELNQPLGSIRNYMSGCIAEIRKGGGACDALLPGIEKIPDLVDRAAAIIKRLRDFSRAEEDDIQTLSMKEVVSHAADLLGPRLERLKIRLDVNVADDMPVLFGDPLRLEQVVLNLMMNGCDAMSKSLTRVLTVTVEPVDNRRLIRVSVADTGPGIPAALREQVFEAFYTTKPKGKGQGLGLSISKSIIKEFGGTLNMESGPEGGTVFSFTLSVANGDYTVD
jgi:signal transduction histidine kinase